MHWIQTFLQKYSELAVYLSLGIGFAGGLTSGALTESGLSVAPWTR